MLDGPTFVQLIAAIAWPITALAVALLFRHEIRHTADRLSSVTYGDLKADFEHDLKRVEKQVGELPLQVLITEPQRRENKETLNAYERLRRIADISPRAAIMEAWRDIEVTTKEVTDAYGISSAGQIAGVRAITELVRRHLLPESLVSVYERMRRLRSRAAHAADFAISPEEAERYIDTAYRFHNTLLLLLEQSSERANPQVDGVTTAGPVRTIER